MDSHDFYRKPGTMSRSRVSSDSVGEAADAMMRISLSRSPSSSSSSVSTVTPYSGTPSTQLSTSSYRGNTRGDSAKKAGGGARQPSTVATTSRTREQLRRVEAELESAHRVAGRERERASEMRRLADEEHALAERLRREGGATALSASEIKRLVLELKTETKTAMKQSALSSTAGLFKEACSTDLLFLMDTTGSMHSYINAAKEQVRSIVKDIKAAFLNEAEVRVAVVGYKDHRDSPNIQFLDFTPSTDRVYSFLDELKAIGGDDIPEDVLGGVRQALNATWKQQTRCIIHIADAPPHGINTLNDLSSSYDQYSIPGSEPHRLTHEPLLKQMIALNVNYVLLRVNNSTDRMAFAFYKAYAAALADCSLHPANKYHSEARGMRTTSCGGAGGGLLFDEMELGTTYDALRHLVVRSVTSSATRTAVRVSAARMANAGKPRPSDLASINEDDENEDVPLEAGPPKWHIPGWLDETLVVKGFSPDVVVPGAGTLDAMMAGDDNIKMSVTELTIYRRSRPFAQGALRLASYAGTAASTNPFVVKSFKKGGRRLAHMAEHMRCQALCKAFALEFNALTGEEHPVDFTVTTCLEGWSGAASDGECMSLEPFIDGAYVKYNSNAGWVNEDVSYDHRFSQAAQAFSHFTFERSRGRFLVSDLQGVGHMLTDPAIHTRDPDRFRLSETNLGSDGFKFFFASHECNAVCQALGFRSDKFMFVSGKFDFRPAWPNIDDTVCCSNKLCGRILRLSSANVSDDFPGHHWCDTCWPQLYSFVVSRICVAMAPGHDFNVSAFYYESQGRVAPRKCPEHHRKDEPGPAATAAAPDKKSSAGRTVSSRLYSRR